MRALKDGKNRLFRFRFFFPGHRFARCDKIIRLLTVEGKDGLSQLPGKLKTQLVPGKNKTRPFIRIEFFCAEDIISVSGRNIFMLEPEKLRSLTWEKKLEQPGNFSA
jgi:hypothetical protein